MDLVLVWYWKSNVFCFAPFVFLSAITVECLLVSVSHCSTGADSRLGAMCWRMMCLLLTGVCFLMAFINILLSCIQLSLLFYFSEAKIQKYWLTFLFIMGGWIDSETLRYKLLVQLVFSFPRCCLPNLSKKCFKMLWRSGSPDCWLWCYSPGVPWEWHYAGTVSHTWRH